MSIPFTHLDKLYIDGHWVPTTDYEAVLNPATEAVIGHAPVGDKSTAEAAIAAARHAFDHGPWPLMSMHERAGYLRRLHAALVAEREAIAALIIAEVGCSQGVTYGMQVDMPLGHVLTAIDQSLNGEPRQIATHTAPNPFNPGGPLLLGGGSIEREPIGVVAGITGYNFPFLLNLAKVFPASWPATRWCSNLRHSPLLSVAVRATGGKNRASRRGAEYHYWRPTDRRAAEQ